MKYLYIILPALFITMPVHAECPFTDQFSIKAPPAVKILDARAAGNLHYDKENDINFSLSCADDDVRSSGYLYIDIGYNDHNKCNLVIHDGPSELNPTVTTIHCEGKISYAEMYHHFGSYQYILKFVG